MDKFFSILKRFSIILLMLAVAFLSAVVAVKLLRNW